ncbi:MULTISPECIES: hypothetical protein [Streptacidiphilus]|uniref:Uncharacterized protein n=1 Tax=Streptacidiphilus cavernicola TaxID=3342716 RepID=A0ABV6UZT4_9ACTN|nr:hypothetical protein [Streptacidiphilus jeojiense]
MRRIGEVRLSPVVEASFDQAYEEWRSSLRSVTSGAAELSEWQDRFRFAHSVGALLTSGAGDDAPPVSGPVFYGVYLHGTGLAYVGQTQEAERRLRDLPIGEDHHLANTVPPELWERVIVVQWAKLLMQLDARERTAVESMGLAVYGLALEHLLQVHMQPPLNARRRTRDGDWRPRPFALLGLT